jgi:UDP-hydrolysing UDP-N-acetyl-D-glucosamine 2-epimerase
VDKRRVCVVTGSRAEYGLLYPLLRALQEDPAFDLQIMVTGMHLSPDFGLTYKVIESDGFRIDVRVEMLLSSDTPLGTAKSLGLGVIGFAEALERLAPDLVVVLGDRYEIFAAAQAALMLRIPLAHIGGGDTTEGAIDEAIRHSITKMAHLHFVTHCEAAERVLQMGEDSARVFNVGTPGLDAIRFFPVLHREATQSRLNFSFRARNLLVTFHPVTLAPDLGVSQFEELTAALDRLGDQFGILFTRPNADASGRALIARQDAFVERHPNARAYTSLGQQLYYSVLAQVDAVVGNSSSGLYEAPSFHKPTVDIGERQRGRFAADSVIHCEPEADAIATAIDRALTMDCSATVNPYGDGHSVERIMAVLRRRINRQELLQKRFHRGGVA